MYEDARLETRRPDRSGCLPGKRYPGVDSSRARTTASARREKGDGANPPVLSNSRGLPTPSRIDGWTPALSLRRRVRCFAVGQPPGVNTGRLQPAGERSVEHTGQDCIWID